MGLWGFCKAGGERVAATKLPGSGECVPLQGKPRRPPARNLGPWKSGRKFIFFFAFSILFTTNAWRSFHRFFFLKKRDDVVHSKSE
jgi:hypothetical protein